MTQKRAVTPTLSERCALKPHSKSNHAARMRQGYENCEFLPLRGVIHALCTDHHAGKCYNQGPAGVPGGGRAGSNLSCVAHFVANEDLTVWTLQERLNTRPALEPTVRAQQCKLTPVHSRACGRIYLA